MTLREALQAVYDARGELTAEIIVEVASTGDDAVAQRLHDALPWDADEALEKYQLVVANRIIRKYKIRYEPSPGAGLRETRAFVSVQEPTTGKRSYHPNEVVRADPFLERLALQDAERRWRELKAAFGALKGFYEMVRNDLDEEMRDAA